jgi:hypothetical protein
MGYGWGFERVEEPPELGLLCESYRPTVKINCKKGKAIPVTGRGGP